MDRVARVDRGGPVSKITKVAGGGVRVDGALTRSGVFRYQDAEGRVRLEYRPPEEVFAEDTLRSLAAAPVTDLHPAEPVTPATWRRDAVGHVGDDIRTEAPYVVAGVVVQDAATVAKIPIGRDPGPDDRVELSCGYTCGLEMTPGVTPQGERYDAIQRGIEYNHVALLPRGDARGGPEIRLRLDSGECISTNTMAEKTDTTKDDEIKALRERAEKAEAKADALEKSVPKRVAERSAIIAKAIGWGVIKADEAGAPAAGDDDTIIRGILKKAMPMLGKSLDLMTHEILMSLLQDVAGSAPAPTEEPAAPADAPPAPGGMPHDSIHATRDLPPDPKNVPHVDSLEDARRKAHTKSLNRWRGNTAKGS